MKITVLGRITQKPDGGWQAPSMIFGSINLDASYDPSATEPTRLYGGGSFPTDGVWAYRGMAVSVKGGSELSLEEIKLKIKHVVLRHDKGFARMRQEVEAFENLEHTDVARRERIPHSVRLFVWQRDQGKCVKCGNSEKLEFDHVIPVVKGGSNTERNIQLLCEQCNRSKGASI